jgi:UDP-N-acetylmuramoyl-tripeptide--D-alanyl-D-alanine ligase
MVLKSIKEIAVFLGQDSKDNRTILQAYVDGRLCQPEGLYFALKGEKSDGHAFLDQAAKGGAIAAVVEESYQGEDFGLTLIRVKDTLEALHNLAKSVIKERNPFVVGITGSIGKTTVKEFLGMLLQTSYKVSRTPNSYNGQIGLPLTILNADPSAEILILEMGMSYKNEMKKLVEIVSPHLAIMTRVAPAHIGHFSSLEEIAEEKANILSGENVGLVFVHDANKHYSFMNKECSFNKITYGGKESDYVLKQENTKVTFIDKKGKESVLFDLPFSETHLVENFFVAALVAKHLNVADEELQQRACHLKPFKHRFEKLVFKTYPKTLFVDDSHNNNPISLKTSLQNLPKPQKQHKTIAILGEMRELGSLSKIAHEEAAIIALPIVDLLICYGEETKPLYEIFNKYHKKAYHTLEKEHVRELLLEHLEDGDVVFIKGANSNKLWEILDKMEEKICSLV